MHLGRADWTGDVLVGRQGQNRGGFEPVPTQIWECMPVPDCLSVPTQIWECMPVPDCRNACLSRIARVTPDLRPGLIMSHPDRLSGV